MGVRKLLYVNWLSSLWSPVQVNTRSAYCGIEFKYHDLIINVLGPALADTYSIAPDVTAATTEIRLSSLQGIFRVLPH